eukprot:TRINITY_DN31105_c0_g2_i1.p1 TRINITY_DN31105_c0_g2~~TRINITY_DN31105_c0_g2_i1.p1  ORF type:complete len:236 (-),score=-32.70 TRINITY_DN31105_c0_g2_i1:219-926(-)
MFEWHDQHHPRYSLLELHIQSMDYNKSYCIQNSGNLPYPYQYYPAQNPKPWNQNRPERRIYSVLQLSYWRQAKAHLPNPLHKTKGKQSTARQPKYNPYSSLEQEIKKFSEINDFIIFSSSIDNGLSVRNRISRTAYLSSNTVKNRTLFWTNRTRIRRIIAGFNRRSCNTAGTSSQTTFLAQPMNNPAYRITCPIIINGLNRSRPIERKWIKIGRNSIAICRRCFCITPCRKIAGS